MQVVDSEGYLKVKLVGGPVGPFVPYTGATANVDLGEYEIKAGQFTLDTSPTGTAVVGTTRWNDAIGSSETTLKGGSVILKNGVDLVARVVNKVTPNTTLTKAGYAAVRVSGAQGQRLAVAYAQADSDANSADTIGLVTETIATNQEGFIMTVGQLEGVNTTGSLQGETWVDGSVLYLSPTIPGALTNIKPNGLTGHIVVMGYVEYAHAINGKIYVKIMNGWELDELHNVYINPATIANNNILQYDSADQLWKNQVLNTGITIGTTAIASGTIGRVLFQGTGNVLQQSSSLFWDSTNNRLGIGTDTPTQTLEVVKNQNATTKINISNTTSGTASSSELALTSDSSAGYFNVGKISTAQSNYKIFAPKDGVFYNAIGGDISILNDASGGKIKFSAGQSATAQMTIASTGNVLINTTTDAGFKLDVNGPARVVNTLRLDTEIVPSASAYTNGPLLSFVTASGWASGRRPGISFWGQGNSGIYFYYDGGLNFRAINDAGQSMTFASTGFVTANQPWTISGSNISYSTGNVGIGTSSPAQKLDVNGNTQITGNLIFPAGERLIQYGTSSFFAGRDAAAVYLAYGFGAQETHIGSASTGNIRLRTTANVILDQGTSKLLIGTTTDAGFRLDVNGSARVSGVLTIANASSNISGGSSGLALNATYFTDFQFASGGRLHRLASNQFGINSFIGNNIAIGYDPTGSSPASAKIELGAGTATAGTAPLKLRAGTNLTTPENGAFEYDGTNLYFTVGGVRKTVVLL